MKHLDRCVLNPLFIGVTFSVYIKTWYTRRAEDPLHGSGSNPGFSKTWTQITPLIHNQADKFEHFGLIICKKSTHQIQRCFHNIYPFSGKKLLRYQQLFSSIRKCHKKLRIWIQLVAKILTDPDPKPFIRGTYTQWYK